MKHYDDQLRQLEQAISENKRLSAGVETLRERRNILQSRVWNLKRILEKEQSELDRLEKPGLTVFFLRLTGKLGEKLSVEQAELCAARVKYDAAEAELKKVAAELEAAQGAHASLRSLQLQYEAVFREKQAAIRATGGPNGEALLALERELSALNVQKKELDEAVLAGTTALRTTEQILDSLDSAKGWGTWDLAGGGLVADVAKHSHLDDAQERVERLQDQLRRFRTELTDVQVQANLQVNTEGFLRFADYFFDGLFSSWAVLDRIGKAQWQVKDTRKQIESVLSGLKPLQVQTDARQKSLIRQIDDLVRQA